MSSITYFQRYNQKENWITNSTLLLLSRLNRFDPFKFQKLLEILLTDTKDEFLVGVKFRQQVAGESSVADGVLEQQGFRLVIETKLYDNFKVSQLRQHVALFKGYSGTGVLLALSANKVNNTQDVAILESLRDIDPNVKFVSISYKGLIDAISSVLSPTDFEMHEILSDYGALCSEGVLITLKAGTMLVATAGWSLKENLRYGVYYDPPDRTHSLPFDYIGLYNAKAIRAVGKVLTQAVCRLENNKLIDMSRPETLTNAQKKLIKEVIENTPYYDLAKGTRFFLVDKFYEIEARKKEGSVRGKQFVFLKDQFKGFVEGMSGSELAEVMNGDTWN